jgi:hypothetical protein
MKSDKIMVKETLDLDERTLENNLNAKTYVVRNGEMVIKND